MFSVKGKLPSAEEIQERIDKRYDELYYKPEKGKRIPYVCVVCDSFIVGKDQLEDCFECVELRKGEASVSVE